MVQQGSSLPREAALGAKSQRMCQGSQSCSLAPALLGVLPTQVATGATQAVSPVSSSTAGGEGGAGARPLLCVNVL